MCVCVYYELIVSLYDGANTCWMFGFLQIFKFPQLSIVRLLLICVSLFDEPESQLKSQIATTSQLWLQAKNPQECCFESDTPHSAYIQ